MLSRKWLLAVPVGALLLFSLAAAQDAQPNPDRPRRFDPARMRERMLESFKEDLSPTDEEWNVLKPKLEKVMEARRETMGDFGMFGRRGRDRGREGEPPPPPPPPDRSESKVAKAQRDLGDLLKDKEAKPEQIKEKVKALRDAREKAQADLKAAQKDLKEVCTVRQEAVLVMNGTLE